jgi:hypothetical protein
MLTLQAVLGDATADHAEGHVLVSIYESGSSDDTPKFLAVMEVLLLAVGEWVRGAGHSLSQELVCGFINCMWLPPIWLPAIGSARQPWYLLAVVAADQSMPAMLLPVQLLLTGIPHAITANGTLTRNDLERIAFLAQVRMQCVAAMMLM